MKYKFRKTDSTGFFSQYREYRYGGLLVYEKKTHQTLYRPFLQHMDCAKHLFGLIGLKTRVKLQKRSVKSSKSTNDDTERVYSGENKNKIRQATAATSNRYRTDKRARGVTDRYRLRGSESSIHGRWRQE